MNEDNASAATAAVIQFAIRRGWKTTAPGFLTSRRYHIERLLEHGTERLQSLVAAHDLGLEPAACFATDQPPEAQNTATVDEIRKYYADYRAAHKRTKREGPSKKAARLSHRRQRNEAAIAAAHRLAAKPKVTDEEFGRPPPELLDQQYPGREPGVTYAHVHREEHGPIWHNVSRRRQLELARKLKELASELEKSAENLSILDPEQMASVQKRWRIAMSRLREKLYQGDES